VIRVVTLAGAELALPGNDLGLEILNPFFQTDAIPGTSTDAFNLPATGENPRHLNFPHLSRTPGGPPPVPVLCYLDGVLWRRGSLVFRSYDATKRVYRYNFVADASDLAKQLRELRLPALPLAPQPFVRATNTAGYVLAPVRNAEFFDDKNPAFKGVLNYFSPAGGLAPASAAQVFVPMFYLVPLLREIMAQIGYSVAGDWVDDAEIQTLVVYSDRALPAGLAEGADLLPARHLPDITVPELLLALQNMFCLGLYFQPGRRELRISALRNQVARQAYLDRPGALLRTSTANETAGFWLKLQPDEEDELDKTLNVGWQERKLGAGQEKITVAAGTLHMVREADPNLPARRWLLPAIAAKGASTEYELGDDTRTGLRLLFNRGPQPDSQGQDYRLLSAECTNYAGARVGQYSLHLDGPDGLCERWHKPWLDFRSRAVVHEYEVPFRIADLLALDPGRQELVDRHLMIWEKVSLKVRSGSRLLTATITYQELL
jgi:hypothetical protein